MLDRRTCANPSPPLPTEKAVAECISDDALIHLKSYKYSAVDKSPISNYILRPYVCIPPV
jgi:ethanolaminephosphotransferase